MRIVGIEQRSTERSEALSRFVDRDSCSNLKDLRNIDSLLLTVPINYIANVRSMLPPWAHFLSLNITFFIRLQQYCNVLVSQCQKKQNVLFFKAYSYLFLHEFEFYSFCNHSKVVKDLCFELFTKNELNSVEL